MSLGIKSIRGAHLSNHGLSLIPRASLISSPSTSQPIAITHQRFLSSRDPDPAIASPKEIGQYGNRTVGSAPSIESVISPVTLADRLASLPVRQHGPRESVLVEPRIEYPHRRETHQSKRRNHQGITAQLRLERIRAVQRIPQPNWRVVLHNLTSWTPKYSHASVGLLLSSNAVDLLLSDRHTNLSDIRSRTGISIKIDPKKGEDGSRSLFLSGNRSDIDRAVEDILEATKGISSGVHLGDGQVTIRGRQGLTPLPDQQATPNSSALDIQEVPTPSARSYALATRADKIPKPSHWTKTSLEGYVLALTRGRLLPNLASDLYPRGASHDEAVIKQLHHVFNDPAARRSLSTPAFKEALAFMARKGDTFRPHARALFVRMEMFGLRMDTEVFNLLAENAVKARDLRNFSTTLNLMVNRGHHPNLGTWLLFLRLIKSEEVKRYILHSMNQTGLLEDPSAAPLVARELVSHDVDRAIQQGKDLPAFLADQDSLYGGPNWLYRETGNKAIEVFGRHGRFDDCESISELMMRRGASSQPDVTTLNTIMTHCKLQNNLHRAVDVLHSFETGTSIVPNSVTYHLLSELGWRQKLPHVAGLLWRYSCLVGKTSYRMRRRTGALLLRRARRQANANANGSVVHPLEDGSSQPPGNHPPSFPSSSSSPLLVSDPTSKPKSRSLETIFLGQVVGDTEREMADASSGPGAVRQMLQWYKQHRRNWEPAVPLSGLLREAIARDARLLRELKEGVHEEGVPAIEPVAVPTRKRTEGVSKSKTGQAEDCGE